MNSTIEFLMKQHEHVLESIKLADQKAAAIIAISVGTIYLLFELMKAPCFAPWPWKCAGGLAQILLILSTGATLWTVATADRSRLHDVKGGEHTIPHLAAQLSQDEYEQWAVSATADERAKEVATLVYFRMKIRAWKYTQVEWAIRFMYAAYALLLLLVTHLMVHTVRTRKARTPAPTAHAGGGQAPAIAGQPAAPVHAASATPAGSPDGIMGTSKKSDPRDDAAIASAPP